MSGFFLKESEQLRNAEHTKIIAPKLLKYLEALKEYALLGKEEQRVLRKSLFSEDAREVLKENNNPDFQSKKSWKELLFNFFGMNDHWPLKRNLLGAFMVHCPEYPTYFIPAYSQAKAKGEAQDLKKGEGYRGAIVGGLEGVAVGALVSGKKLKFGEMIPYILLGMGLQYFSSKVFPWLGEKLGRMVYERNLNKKQNNPPPKKEVAALPSKTTFKGFPLYNKSQINTSGNLKI